MPTIARIAVLTMIFVSMPAAGSDIEQNDRHARNTIFGDDHLAENVHDIHVRAARLLPAERFEFLADQVLPSETHPTFRVTGVLNRVSVPPHLAADVSPFGDSLATPVFDLIDSAQRTGQLEQLRDRITRSPAAETDQQRRRAAVLFLVNLVRDDVPSATAALDELMRLADDSIPASAQARWPDLLVLWRGIPDPRTRRMLADYYFTVYTNLVPYVEDAQLDVMNDYLRALSGLRRVLDDEDAPGQALLSADGGVEWVAFNYSDASTRGRGRPHAHWQLDNGEAFKCAGHELDYLSFRSPLRGDYQVECDFSYGPGLNVSLLAAGVHVEAVTPETVQIGNFRKQTRDVPIAPPLTSFRRWGHFRAVVHDDVLTHYVNGRQILRTQLSPDHDPWVAIRTWRRSQASIRNLRITGNPVIPAEINLSADPQLNGWAPYFDERFGLDEGSWGSLEVATGQNEIRGKRRPDLAGSMMERLLRYHRPLIENGTIEYEFVYQEHDICVHPALDRMAFLLDPDGVRIHWITDGRFESSLDPANAIEEPGHRRGPDRLPLIDNDWNRVRLTVTGDAVELALNGQAVYERRLNEDNARTFGLFHYADRTEARVRNVVWRGEWPRELPTVPEQRLADTELEFLDETRLELAAELHQDFRNGVPTELFDFTGDETSITRLEDGIRTERTGVDGLQEICGCFQLHGDYDICVRFRDLEIQMPGPAWQAGIGVMTHLENLTHDSCALYRRVAQNADDHRAAFAHKAQQAGGDVAYSGEHLVDESLSGRLRLARRGDAVYSLFAEGDSPNFRLVSRAQVPADDVAYQGLRLVLQSDGSSRVGATWTDLDVRAERISGLPVANAATLLAGLNHRRHELPGREIDFSSEPTVDAGFFQVFGPPESRIALPSGLRLAVSTNDDRPTAALVSRFTIGEEFDIEADLSIDRLDDPERLGAHSEVAFHVFLQNGGGEAESDRPPIEAALILRQKANGVRDLVARVVTRDRAGTSAYSRLRSLHVRSPDQFRIALYEQRICFLYSESDSADVRVVAEYPVADSLSAASVMLATSASGAGRVTEVTWKRLSASGIPRSSDPVPIDE